MPSAPRKSTNGSATGEAYELRNYRLLERVGQEELATVYRAAHLTLDRPARVHILRRTDWISAGRFQLAARLAARLSHPNLLPVIDAGHDDRLGDYTVTPAIEAQSLEQLLKNGPLAPAQALRILSQIGSAIDYLHSQQVIHRDLQPANILVTREGVAYLANLSLAASPETPDLSGVDEADYLTPYAAPEQNIASSEAQASLDIYALGAVLYHMLSGQVPPGPGQPLPSLGTVNPSLAPTDRILQRMLDNSPAQRYSSAAQALAAVRQSMRPLLDQATDDMQESRWAPVAEWLENPVETAIGDLFQNDYLARSRHRADRVHRVGAVQLLLDRWSRKNMLRRPMLGRLIEPEQIVSYNLYFFELQVQFDTRTAARAEEQPLVGSHPLTDGLPADDVWEIRLPDTAAFTPAPRQRMVVPHSERVRVCPDCQGSSQIVCRECKGKGQLEPSSKLRVTTPTVRPEPEAEAKRQPERGSAPLPPTEQVPEPCPACRGYGHQKCTRCGANGNVLEQQVFEWERRVRLYQNTDDLEGLPRFALEPRTESVFTGQIDPWSSRWNTVAPIQEMIAQAIGDADKDTRLVAAEIKIRGVPVTEVDYMLRDKTHRLALIGFDSTVRGDFSLLDLERIAIIAVGAVLLLALLFWLLIVML